MPAGIAVNSILKLVVTSIRPSWGCDQHLGETRNNRLLVGSVSGWDSSMLPSREY